MESNFSNREFEQYIKSTADQYRMIPTDKVWKNINSTLHTRRKWYGFGLALLLLSTAVSVTWVMVSDPGSKKQVITAVPGAQSTVQTMPVNQIGSSIVSAPKDISSILSPNRFSSAQDNASV